MEVLVIIVSFVSLGIMIGLYVRTTKLQQFIAKVNKYTLEFMVNLVINAAADPRTLRRLVIDYTKENRWRAGVFYKGDKYNISWEMPAGPTEITIGDIKIAVIGLSQDGTIIEE